MARVTTHLSVSDLEREYRVAKEATAARHYQAIWLQRCLQGVLRGTARALRPRSRCRKRAFHHPGDRRRQPGLEVPDGLRLVYLPRYSPQLQPAECLWSVLDQPIANKYFETIEQLEAVVAEPCRTLDTSPDLFKGPTNFHWWPKTHRPN